jgi:hypothetical protein
MHLAQAGQVNDRVGVEAAAQRQDQGVEVGLREGITEPVGECQQAAAFVEEPEIADPNRREEEVASGAQCPELAVVTGGRGTQQAGAGERRCSRGLIEAQSNPRLSSLSARPAKLVCRSRDGKPVCPQSGWPCVSSNRTSGRMDRSPPVNYRPYCERPHPCGSGASARETPVSRGPAQ